MTIETLTDEERDALVDFDGIELRSDAREELGEKALRCIDERDAEIARLREESATWQGAFMRSDEKRRAHQAAVRAHERHGACAETAVARLTQRCEALDDTAAGAQHARDEARAEVARLKEALAAAERLFLVGKSDATLADWTALLQRAEVAEARCQDYVTLCDREREMRQAAEARARELKAELGTQLAAAERALLEHTRRSLEAQVARDAAEARVRELEAELDGLLAQAIEQAREALRDGK